MLDFRRVTRLTSRQDLYLDLLKKRVLTDTLQNREPEIEAPEFMGVPRSPHSRPGLQHGVAGVLR